MKGCESRLASGCFIWVDEAIHERYHVANGLKLWQLGIVDRYTELFFEVNHNINHPSGVDVQLVHQTCGFGQRSLIGAAALIATQHVEHLLQYFGSIHCSSHFLKTIQAFTSPKPKLTFRAVERRTGVQTLGIRACMSRIWS